MLVYHMEGGCMERMALKKQGLALGISISLVALIFFILTPPVTAVYLHPGTPDPTSVSSGGIITFNNVNFTIRGAEAIPVEFLKFTVYKSNGDVQAWVKFTINGTIISSSGTFTIPTVVGDEGIPYQSSGSLYGYDENTPHNYTYNSGYGYNDGSYSDITILYTIQYTTSTIGLNFYAKLSVNSSTHTYESDASSTFVVTTTGGGDDDDDDDDAADDDDDVVADDDDDDEGEQGTQTSEDNVNDINDEYGIELEDPFYANDTDGDGKVDTLTDPNGILTQVQNTTINGNTAILVSTDDDEIPEFFWDPETDTVTSITHSPGTVSDEEIDPENETLTVTVTVEKEESQWIYLDIADNYPDYAVTIKTSDGRTISSDMLWRENGKIYVLDDPDTEYLLIYSYVLLAPTFNPLSGTTSDVSKPIITITYKEAISKISSVTFTLEGTDIPYDLGTLDNIIYTITPKTNLTVSGTLQLSLTAKDADGNTLTSSATYTIELPGVVAPPSKEEEDGMPWFIIAVIVIALVILFLVYLFKTGYLYVEYDEHEKGEKADHKTKETKPHKKSDTSQKDSKTEKKKK